ncbi:MAG TPA: hypothetical protein VEW48_01945 [Thermoanaerobaculia bacterium]|nr:hypothetical protein [Thermoanaerobaculia bacterium]
MKSLLLALTAAALSVAPLGAQALSAGPEIHLLSAPFGNVYESSIAAAADGSFLAVWQGGLGQIVVRPFSPSDTPLLAVERQVSSSAGQDLPLAPRAAALASGRYVVGWTVEHRVSSHLFELRTIVRIVDSTGQPVSGEILVSTTEDPGMGFYHLPVVDLAAEPTGGFVVAWEQQALGTILAQRFDAAGSPAGPQVTVSDHGILPSVAALPGGGFAVAWFNGEPVLRLFRPDGLPATPETRVADPLAQFGGAPYISADATGRLVVAWSEHPADAFPFVPTWWVRARRFGPDGQPLSPPLVVAATNGGSRGLVAADVAARPSGSFLVTWWEFNTVTGGPDFDPHYFGDVFARAFEASGLPLGDAFLVHTSTKGEQYPGEAAPTPGGWIVSWTRQLELAGFFARRFSLVSCGTGAELCLNDRRFRVAVSWLVSPSGAQGDGQPIELTGDTGAFWFFNPTNTELLVKILDGRLINGHFWVFYGSLTNVAFDLTVTDTATGQQRTYHNPSGTMASRADTEAF